MKYKIYSWFDKDILRASWSYSSSSAKSTYWPLSCPCPLCSHLCGGQLCLLRSRDHCDRGDQDSCAQEAKRRQEAHAGPEEDSQASSSRGSPVRTRTTWTCDRITTSSTKTWHNEFFIHYVWHRWSSVGLAATSSSTINIATALLSSVYQLNPCLSMPETTMDLSATHVKETNASRSNSPRTSSVTCSSATE